MEIAAFIVTVIVGFAADSLLYTWPNAGAVFAAATAGAFILWAVRHPKDEKGER